MDRHASEATAASPGRAVEVFADVVCPFTHIGLRRFVERRAELGRRDVSLWIRAWPLEIVNGAPVDPTFIRGEVDDIRRQVAPDLFGGFNEAAFPVSSIPALSLATAAYGLGLDVGEQVSLELRDLVFEQGVDIARPPVLAEVARRHGLEPSRADRSAVLAEHAEGVRRGVVGSPHFFVPSGGFFCPSFDVSRDEQGHLRVFAHPERFERFVEESLS